MVVILEEIKRYTKLNNVIFGCQCIKILIIILNRVFHVHNLILVSKKTPSKLKPINPPDGVWQLVSMDFHGPITPTSQRGNKYIISLTDILSKFVATKAVRDNTAQTTVRFL
ncbi:unnamed protein product [Rotaria socialis]|uniref:Integrase catalytic domain-containing protein n=1 Tax=Rotaria socialis TaxID=392032 RepID=A0A817XY11_9BILA|nr:unnamed protein product [Rotaria socialis]CAF3372479.1 unnamed protein product [Rotaria socialis]CAF3406522.1 unnamed protein product [Rotaria socialis]CAF3481255.1 unnamed protein product [Rotaria socialis]CAF3684801.1 unnamed protein product [Rotaria socialis]